MAPASASDASSANAVVILLVMAILPCVAPEPSGSFSIPFGPQPGIQYKPSVIRFRRTGA
jgi:hypothetical protein